MSLFERDIDEAYYDLTTVVVHWIVAGLVIMLWIAGQLIDDLPDGPLQDNLWSTHVVGGFLLALVFLFRIAWRLGAGRHLAPVGASVMRATARLVHGGLYALLFAVVTLGIANAFDRGYKLYGLATLPQIGDPHLKHALTDWHGLAANLLLFLVFIHASAALFHHYIRRDGVLRRMLPGAAPPR